MRGAEVSSEPCGAVKVFCDNPTYIVTQPVDHMQLLGPRRSLSPLPPHPGLSS
jgi:hypothetical protein